METYVWPLAGKGDAFGSPNRPNGKVVFKGRHRIGTMSRGWERQRLEELRAGKMIDG